MFHIQFDFLNSNIEKIIFSPMVYFVRQFPGVSDVQPGLLQISSWIKVKFPNFELNIIQVSIIMTSAISFKCDLYADKEEDTLHYWIQCIAKI